MPVLAVAVDKLILVLLQPVDDESVIADAQLSWAMALLLKTIRDSIKAKGTACLK